MNKNANFFNRLWALIGLTPLTPESKETRPMSKNTFRATVISLTFFPANERGANGAILCRAWGKNGQTLKQSRLVDLKKGVTHELLNQLKAKGLDKRAVIEFPIDLIAAHDPEPRGNYKGDRFFKSTDANTGEVTEEPIHRVEGLDVSGIVIIRGMNSVDDETVAKAVAAAETELAPMAEQPKQPVLAGVDDEVNY